MDSSEKRPFKIIQISDLHVGSQYFVPELLEQTIDEVNSHKPDVVIVSGDLTAEGFLQEYQEAREYIGRVKCNDLMVVPGNHDSRNVGYLHFEDIFGGRSSVMHREGISIVAVDSSEPDLDHGVVGRDTYRWIKECYSQPAKLRIFVLHHHLIPVPGTGRERNIVHDAGDVLECLVESEVNLVLSGHKHVPYAWRLENMFIVNAGTVSTQRLRGRTRACYNSIEIEPGKVSVYREYPFDGKELIIEFSPKTFEFEKDESMLEHRPAEG